VKPESKYLFLIVSLILFSGVILAQNSTPVITDVKQENDGTMKIRWSIGSEEGIDHYEVFRSTGTAGQFSHIGDVPHGTFVFTDSYDLFKTTGRYFRYQVKALHGETVVGLSAVVGASYNSTSSAAKRTWGSIKAMFR
jgi:hypothetical protein